MAIEQDPGDLDQEPDEPQDTAQDTTHLVTQTLVSDAAVALEEAAVAASEEDTGGVAEASGDQHDIPLLGHTTPSHI